MSNEFVDLIDSLTKNAEPFVKGCVLGLLDAIFSMKGISIVFEKIDKLKYGGKQLSGYRLIISGDNISLKRVLVVENERVIAYSKDWDGVAEETSSYLN